MLCTVSHDFLPPLVVQSLTSLSSLSTTAAMGAAYGTAKSGVGIAAMSVMRPDLIMKSVIPVVMAGIIAIYGLVVSVLIANKRESQFLQKRCGSSRTIFVISFRPIA